jgi:cytochrome P450
MLSDPLAFLDQTSATYGSVVGLVLGGEYVVLVSDPAVAKDVMIDSASVFVKVRRCSCPEQRHRQHAWYIDTASPYIGYDVVPAPDSCNVLQEGTAFFPGSQLAGNGLLVSDGPVWRRQRQLSNPAFRTAAVASYAQVATSAVALWLGHAAPLQACSAC